MGPTALETADNESGRAKHENVTRRTRHYRKHVREQNMKTGQDALDTAENESGRAKHEIGSRRPRYRRKRVREHKT
jgi:hypothetical protein